MKPQEAENNSDPLSDDIIDVDCGEWITLKDTPDDKMTLSIKK